MDVIYSRTRLKIPKNRKKQIKIIVIFIITIYISINIVKSIKPVISEICVSETKAISNKITNEKTIETMKNYKNDEIVKIISNDENKITGIQMNIAVINEIMSNISLEIQKEIDEYQSKDIGIALGTFSNSKILSGRGPKLYYKISNVGEVETGYKSEFQSVGINQTIHRIYLKIKCNISILTPFEIIKEEIQNQVIISENIIVGEIPQTYYNLEGIEERELYNFIE